MGPILNAYEVVFMMKAAKIMNYLLEMVVLDYVLTIPKQLERF